MKASFSAVAVTVGCAVFFACASQAADFTFVIWSDPHFDYWNSQNQRNNCLNDINGIAGKSYPPAIGGTVDTPAFVLIPGDITDNDLENQWYNTDGDTNNDFISCVAQLLFPYYALRGNHDIALNYGSDFIIDLHGELYYSFDYEGVHFVALDTVGDMPQFPPDQIEWLQSDLARLTPNTPVIPFFHYDPEESHEDWDQLRDVIAGSNVPVILHGHTHSIYKTTWNGYDVYSSGHNKHEDTNNGGFTVVRITDAELLCVSYSWVNNSWFTSSDRILRKPLTGLPRPDNPPAPTPTPPVPGGTDLLVNGGLETYSGSKPNQVATGWTGVNVQNTNFRRSPGMQGQGYGQTMERKHDQMDYGEGYLYQRVAVMPGHTYRLSAWGRPENGGDGRPDDSFAPNTAVVEFGIGLDPSGGTAFSSLPPSQTLVHHTGEDGYGPLAYHRFQLETTASGTTMTVFLSYRIPEWKYRPPRIVWDHVFLIDLDTMEQGPLIQTY
jgi:predicted phosphodiesterase